MSDPIKDYEITVKIRNNHLLRAIRNAGYKNMNQFCKACNISPAQVQAYAGLKMSPLRIYDNGREVWRQSILDIADALYTVPENLFPIQHIRKCLPKNQTTIETSIADIEFLLEQRDLTTEKLVESSELRLKVRHAISTLTPREQDIINRKFFSNETNAKVGKNARLDGEDLSVERVRQIEARAVRRIGRRLRSIDLHPVIEAHTLDQEQSHEG